MPQPKHFDAGSQHHDGPQAGEHGRAASRVAPSRRSSATEACCSTPYERGGQACLFVSHKYHSRQPCDEWHRQVLVMELTHSQRKLPAPLQLAVAPVLTDA